MRSGFFWYFFSLHVGLAPIFMTLAEFNSIINKLSLIDRASLLFVFFCLSLWIWRKSCYLLNLKSLRSATSWFLGACENFWCLNLLVFQLQIFLWLFIVFYFVAKTRHIEGWLIPFISKNSLQAVKKLEILHIFFMNTTFYYHFHLIFNWFSLRCPHESHFQCERREWNIVRDTARVFNFFITREWWQCASSSKSTSDARS